MQVGKTVTHVPKADINSLVPQRSIINLDQNRDDQFSLLGYALDQTYNDIILLEFVDVVKGVEGDLIQRNGVLIPLNAATKAWRIGRVVLAGSGAINTKPGDLVCFPNDRGIPVSALDVVIDGKARVVSMGVFINEERLFGRVQEEDYE